jgi:hypothetical protein
MLGLVGWIDLILFSWGLLSITILFLLSIRLSIRRKRSMGPFSLTALLLALAVASPQFLALFRNELLVRIPGSEEVIAYTAAFRDIFVASSDMRWLFVLAVLALPSLWRRRGRFDLNILSCTASAYILWLGALVLYHVRPLSEPDTIFHLIRFSTALAAGIGGYQSMLWLMTHLKDWATIKRVPLGGVGASRPEPLAVATLLILLLPSSLAFTWFPLRMDAAYYACLQPVDTSVDRLGRWFLNNTEGNERVLTGSETGEWISALTGRRVLYAERALPRDEIRLRRGQRRAVFLSGEVDTMRKATTDLGASVVVLDPELREIFWDFDPTLLETSGLFVKVHQIGDVFSIYRTQ